MYIYMHIITVADAFPVYSDWSCLIVFFHLNFIVNCSLYFIDFTWKLERQKRICYIDGTRLNLFALLLVFGCLATHVSFILNIATHKETFPSQVSGKHDKFSELILETITDVPTYPLWRDPQGNFRKSRATKVKVG